MRKCAKCGKRKPLSSYYLVKKTGYRTIRCNQCRAEDNKKYPVNSKRNYLVAKNRYKKLKDRYGLGAGTIARYGFKTALLVYDRAGRKCETCGEENDLTLHHVDRNGRNNANRGLPMNNDIKNLQVLCRSCHGSIHAKQRKGGK